MKSDVPAPWVVFLGVLLILWVLAPTAYALPADLTPTETAALFECDEPTSGSGDFEVCTPELDLSDGTAEMGLVWYNNFGGTSGYRLSVRNLGVSSGSWGATAPYLFCASTASGWHTFFKGSSSNPSAGSGSLLDAPSSQTGSTSGYIFAVDDPETNYSGEWPTLADVCSAADPGEPAGAPSDTPTVEATGVLLPGEDVRLFLDAPDHDGEEVTCVIQGSASNPYEGTVGSGEFELAAAYVFEVDGIYAVACEADDGVFDDTSPEVGEVRKLVTIGSGLDDVLGGCEFDPEGVGGVLAGLNDYENCLLEQGGACGAWYNIACHLGTALRWAFVPSGAVFTHFVDEVGDTFPFAVFAEFYEVSDALLEAFDADPITPGIEFDVFINGPEGQTVGFYLPSPAELEGTCAGSSCSALEFDGESVGWWGIINNDTGNGGIGGLWGYRDVVRNIATVFLYLGWLWGVWRFADRKMEAST